MLKTHLCRSTALSGLRSIGSGTTGEAAHLEKRQFIGIESETEYFHEIAVPRIRAAQAQFELGL